MIDAYEIGIQLALQDDVSAGLQVISRGLADVDRAIEVTSAKLSNLTNAAEATVGKAVAGIIPRQVVGLNQGVPESKSDLATGTAPSSMKGDGPMDIAPSNAPVTKAPDQAVAGVVQQVVAPTSAEQSKSRSVSKDGNPPMPNAAPAQLQTIAPTIVQIHSSAEPVIALNPAEPASPKSQTITPKAPAAISVVPPPVSKTETRTERLQRSADAPVRQEKVFTASVDRATARPSAPTASKSDLPRPERARGSLAEPAMTATAPWSGMGTRILSTPSTAASERPVAPEARQREQADGLSGQVMLDGHLVGYWLSEHMAKEASRPPTGTSFFDPRQTPAWTASGSL